MVDGKVLIPDLLRSKPSARAVLDRYGLRGCGGEWGPVETLEFFAKAHDVPLSLLLQEIRNSQDGAPAPDSAGLSPDDKLADAIYRPFFKAGILTILSVGAVWGAYLLLRIAYQRSFSAAGLHEVNAHGHAQIFGWVGLFVMGFAYQAFPRFKHTSLFHPRFAWLSLWLMLAGIVVRSVAEPLASSWPALGIAAVAGSTLECAAIGIFIWIIAQTFRAGKRPIASYDYYIYCSLGWFLIQAIYEAVYLAATLAAPDREAVLSLVRTWQGAMREVQIHGFALLMILGVSQRIFPNFCGFPAASRRISLVSLALVNAAVVGEVASLVLMSRSHIWGAVWYGSVLLLVGTLLVLVRSWHIFTKSSEADRSLKFLRSAYTWLFVSLGMLVFLPAYQFVLLPRFAPDSVAAQVGFSHAYYGAARHAITVGFISLMIVGVAAKVVPTLNGVDIRALSPLWGPFFLINAGCALRVSAQIATDFTNLAYPFAGVSGVFEVTGLALWAVHLWCIMIGRARLRRVQQPYYAPSNTGAPITGADRVGEVLERAPTLLQIFLTFGFKPLVNPLLRKTFAARITIDQACRMMDVDARKLLEALNKANPQQKAKLALPVVSDEPSLPAPVPAGGYFSAEPRKSDANVQKENEPCTQPTHCEASIG
jgi:hypothetical protein